MDFITAAILAVVEGLTEFLPISSTGHMILVEDYLHFADGKEFADAFMVIIQLPAILSVVVYFWRDLWPWSAKSTPSQKFALWSRIVVAFLPAAVVGFLCHDYIETYLLNNVVVSLALVIGGILLIVIERRDHASAISRAEDITFKTAFLIGCFQCLAMIPGTSRSAATIIGALLLGANRLVAAEFSFFLAIPTMFAATFFTLAKNGMSFTAHQWVLLGVGSVISFAVAYAVVAGLMRFVQQHRFTVFGVYRIILGLVVLGALYFRFIH